MPTQARLRKVHFMLILLIYRSTGVGSSAAPKTDDRVEGGWTTSQPLTLPVSLVGVRLLESTNLPRHRSPDCWHDLKSTARQLVVVCVSVIYCQGN